jgi:hypothetical protein
MEFKAINPIKVIMGIVAIIFIVFPVYAIFRENISEYKLWFIILFIIGSPLLILMGFDELYQIFRVIIINEKNIKIKLFGIIIKENKIDTIEYSYKNYGIRKITHVFGSVKSIIVNKKYFSCITKMDNNYDKITIE